MLPMGVVVVLVEVLVEVLMASDHCELAIASRNANSVLRLEHTISTNYINLVQRRSGR